jgi:hypothetical protein
MLEAGRRATGAIEDLATHSLATLDHDAAAKARRKKK